GVRADTDEGNPHRPPPSNPSTTRMQVSQLLWDTSRSWRPAPSPLQRTSSAENDRWPGVVGDDSDSSVDCPDAQLVLVFGGRPALTDANGVAEATVALKERFPSASIVWCSGGGQISGVDIHDNTLVATAVRLDH